MLFFYRLLIGFSVWGVLLPLQLLTAISGRSSWSSLRQRMAWGHPPAAVPYIEPGPCILMHAVSAGEMAAVRPILQAIVERQPDLHIYLSTGNQGGMDMAHSICESFPHTTLLGFLPWDRRRALQRWLGRIRPNLVTVVETELWPALFCSCRRLGIPLALVNGRIYPKDRKRYRLVRPLMRRVLGCASVLGVQDRNEQQRFLAVGAPSKRLRVLGNSKFDAALDAAPTPQTVLTTPLLLGVSTHGPEEQWLIRAFQVLQRRHPELLLVLAPRSTIRCGKVLQLGQSLGLDARAWSTGQGRGDWELLVMDVFGRLAPWFAAAEFVFVGGSLVPRGGHNPLEPAAWGRPILIGPHSEHFRGPVALLRSAGALLQVAGPQDLLQALNILMDDPQRRERMGRAARTVVEANGGAAREYADVLMGLMADGAPRP
ncbi:MAG: 3-deoxy-D-manno-octulosonic acid transferase [Anaerolineae bacterium]